MELEKLTESELTGLFVSPDLVLLKILQKRKRPITQDDLMSLIESKSGISISVIVLDALIRGLCVEGYDIKKIYAGGSYLYSLIRNPTRLSEDFYNTLGDVETPFIIASDFHMGSKGFSELAFQRLLKDCEEFSVSSVLMPGDILQGRGVHKLEANDVLLWEIDDQIDFAVGKLNQFPDDVDLKIVIGNHENKIKGSIHVGLDVFRNMAPRVPKMQYYGSVAKLSLNDEKSILMLHSSGGASYTISYSAQKIWRDLIERPDMLVQGHLHRVYAIPTARFSMLCMGGTLQRENAYLINKGIISQPGWLVVEKFADETMDIKYRFPQVY